MRRFERGSFFLFDPNSWEVVRKDNFVVSLYPGVGWLADGLVGRSAARRGARVPDPAAHPSLPGCALGRIPPIHLPTPHPTTPPPHCQPPVYRLLPPRSTLSTWNERRRCGQQRARLRRRPAPRRRRRLRRRRRSRQQQPSEAPACLALTPCSLPWLGL